MHLLLIIMNLSNLIIILSFIFLGWILSFLAFKNRILQSVINRFSFEIKFYKLNSIYGTLNISYMKLPYITTITEFLNLFNFFSFFTNYPVETIYSDKFDPIILHNDLEDATLNNTYDNISLKIIEKGWGKEKDPFLNSMFILFLVKNENLIKAFKVSLSVFYIFYPVLLFWYKTPFFILKGFLKNFNLLARLRNCYTFIKKMRFFFNKIIVYYLIIEYFSTVEYYYSSIKFLSIMSLLFYCFLLYFLKKSQIHKNISYSKFIFSYLLIEPIFRNYFIFFVIKIFSIFDTLDTIPFENSTTISYNHIILFELFIFLINLITYDLFFYFSWFLLLVLILLFLILSLNSIGFYSFYYYYYYFFFVWVIGSLILHIVDILEFLIFEYYSKSDLYSSIMCSLLIFSKLENSRSKNTKNTSFMLKKKEPGIFENKGIGLNNILIDNLLKINIKPQFRELLIDLFNYDKYKIQLEDNNSTSEKNIFDVLSILK